MMETMGIEKLSILLPGLAFIAAGFLVGVVVEKIIFRQLKRLFLKTPWEGGSIIMRSLRGMVIILCTIAGGHGALYNLPLTENPFFFFQKSLVVITILTVTVVVARLTDGLIMLYARRAEALLPSLSLSSHLTMLVIYIIGLLIVFQYLGISITPILTALGVGGLAVALALKDTLANLFAGLHILFSRQVKPGDYIKLHTGEEGYVDDISWRSTSIKTLVGNLVIVPNSNLAAAVITNYYLPEKDVPVRVSLGVSYGTDLEKVEKIALQVARGLMDEMGMNKFEPLVRFQSFGDFSINFLVIMRAKEFADQYLMTHEFIKRLHRRFREEGIEIPFPIRTVYLKKEMALPGGK